VIPTQTKAALVSTVVAFAAGIWLFLAPFIVDYQNHWKTLIDATKSDMWTGGALVGIASLALLLFLAFALRDAAHEARRRLFEQSRGER
jgi:H+/Cl- antiporter ClcA